MPKPLEIRFKHPLFPPTHPTPLHPTPNTNPPDISSRDTKINTWAYADIEKFHIYKQSCTVLFIISTALAFNDKKIRQTTLDWEWWTHCYSIIINLIGWRASVALRWYQTRAKKLIVILLVCSFGFSQGWKSLWNTAVYIMN